MHVPALVKSMIHRVIRHFKNSCPDCGKRVGSNPQCKHCVAFEEERCRYSP